MLNEFTVRVLLICRPSQKVIIKDRILHKSKDKMSDNAGISSPLSSKLKNNEELLLEVERLTRELDQATSERAQSAQYGLSLLKEKSHLEHRVDELETLYDNAKHELEITQEVKQSCSQLKLLFTNIN